MSFRRRSPFVPTALVLAVSGSCGGGGAGGPTYQIGFAAPGSFVDEDGGAADVVLVLEGPAGGVLPEPASVLVTDSGTGTATSGVDYEALTPVAVVFAAGSPVGTQLTVGLTPLPDDLIEGAPETVVLALTDADGAGLGAQATTSVAIADGEWATLRFADASQITPDESSASYPVEIELLLPAGTTLTVDIGVDVADSGVGTATSGADYVPFDTERVVFPAGSPSGSVQTVALTVIDDTLVEGNQSVILVLSAPDPGAVLGGTSTHQIVIQDDETPTGQFLYVSQGPSGTENPMADQSPVWLGDQVVGLGPNGGTLVRLANLGTTTLGVAAPILAGAHPQDFSVVLESASLPPSSLPNDRADLDLALAHDAPAPVGERLAAAQGVAFELDAGLLGALEGRGTITLHGFPLPGRPDGTLALSSVPLPFSADAVLMLDGVPQPGGPRAALEGLTLWTGSVLEWPESKVFLALSPTGAQGFVEFEDSPDRLVHVVTEAAPGADGSPARVRVLEDAGLEALGVLPPPEACAEAREVPASAGAPGPPAGAPVVAGANRRSPRSTRSTAAWRSRPTTSSTSASAAPARSRPTSPRSSQRSPSAT
jgi:hypothetical protein